MKKNKKFRVELFADESYSFDTYKQATAFARKHKNIDSDIFIYCPLNDGTTRIEDWTCGKHYPYNDFVDML